MFEMLLEKVRLFDKPAVLVVGDYILDSYVYGDALRISPEAPVPVLKVVEKNHCCGGAASVAADIRALGAKCRCLGCVGADTNGRTLLSLLEKTGADVSSMLALTDRPTISKQRLVGLAQHKHRQQLMRIDEESTEPLSESDEEKLLKLFDEAVSKTDIVCIEDYGKGLFTKKLLAGIITRTKNAGRLALVDPIMTGDYSMYKGASLITPNRKEASMAAGLEIKTIEDAKTAAQKISHDYDIDSVVITLDKEGGYLHCSEYSMHIPTQPRSVYDVSGAGDMMLATIAVALAAQCDRETSVRLANIAGGLEVEKFGTATVSAEEMIHEIIRLGKGSSGKVREIEALAAQLDYHRRLDHTIVFTNGCFDVLHTGHMNYLKFCKQHGDVLVVGMNSDDSVRRNKGPERPINNQQDRADLLAALEMVDYVVTFDQDTPKELIEQVKPDILIKGQDWAEKGVVGREFVEARGGKVILAPLVEGKSSTSTINKMKQAGDLK